MHTETEKQIHIHGTRKEQQAALEAAAAAQTRYWDALNELETALGIELDDVPDLIDQTVESLLGEEEEEDENEDQQEKEN